MKKWMISLAAAMAMLLVGCAKDDCEKMADVAKDALDGYCKGKSSTCWACDCHNKDQDTDFDANDQIVGCKKKAEDKDDDKCEGEDEKEAKDCLDDKTACKKKWADIAKSGCDETAK